MGEQIKKYRNDMHITQKELADRLYVTQQAVQRWEKGNSYPQVDKVVEIADIFNVSVSDLYFDDTDYVVDRYIQVDVTSSLDRFLKRVNEYATDEQLFMMCHMIYESIDSERDEKGRIVHSVGFDRVQYAAYTSLKKHCNINDLNFWKCVNESDYIYCVSGAYYLDLAYGRCRDEYDLFRSDVYQQCIELFVQQE